MNKIGIDFGTTFCSASRLNPATGKPEVITFHETGLKKMASLVYYSADGVLVGDEVADMLENCGRYPNQEREDLLANTYSSIKRQLKQGVSLYGREGNRLSQPEVIAEILRKIKREAQVSCFRNQPVESVVLTHPVRFAMWQKQMLQEAARLAGFQKIELMEEPVAAAKGYAASGEDIGKGVLVYDFGGGTFDVAFVTIDNEGEYRVPIPSEGDLYCGGDDIDLLLYRHYEGRIQKEYNRAIGISAQTIDIGFLRRCRKHKESLTVRPNINEFEVLPPPSSKNIRLQMDRQTFDSLISDLIDRTVNCTWSLLRKVEQAGYKVDTVVLIGGSSRIPLIAEKLRAVLPVAPLRTQLVDEAVAIGAMVPERVYSEEELKVMCQKSSKAFRNKEYEEAVRLWDKAASNGSVEAQFNLGVCYHQGLGVAVDRELAIEYYQAATERGDVAAAYNRALMLLDDLKDSESWGVLWQYLITNDKLAKGFGAELISTMEAMSGKPKTHAFGGGSEAIQMVLVTCGTFQMGSNYKVALSDYYIGKYAVTQQLWQSVMGSNPSNWKGDNLPVERVSWYDCVAFCNKLSLQEGLEECYRINGTGVELLAGRRGYRLPTEAEWEFAARGGKQSKGYTYAGSNDVNQVAWYNGNSGGKTHPVGKKQPNELGLYDMSGNVWEWCQDWYGDYNSGSRTNPTGPNSGSGRMYRGGSWYRNAENCCVSDRRYRGPGFCNNSLGLRLALVP